jgi:hypothetical protein
VVIEVTPSLGEEVAAQTLCFVAATPFFDGTVSILPDVFPVIFITLGVVTPLSFEYSLARVIWWFREVCTTLLGVFVTVVSRTVVVMAGV